MERVSQAWRKCNDFIGSRFSVWTGMILALLIMTSTRPYVCTAASTNAVT
jgi:hypothetical protein